ncbi:MAG: hypothetical protein KDE14_10550 [Rhodobacteraceae bacterium]|nr:hypothetical protein [Paracoccaceae bacterium]
MTNQPISAPEVASGPVRYSARAIIAAVVGVHAVYGAYWADRLVPTVVELALARDPSQVPVLAAIWPVWTRVLGIAGLEPLLAGRALSIVCATLAILTMFRLLRGFAGDRVVAAGACLLFVAFPPITASWALATPHALSALLVTALLALSLAEQSRGRFIMAGVSAVLLSALHPLGLILTALALVPAAAMPTAGRGIKWRVMAGGFLVLGLGAMLSGVLRPPADIDVSNLGQTGFVAAILLPYVLIWTVLVLSAASLRSAAVRAQLGTGGCAASLAAMIGVPAWAVGAGGLLAPGEVLTSFAYVLPLAVIGAVPLAIWVRFVMPTVKSLAAWILFPVIMYSGFWLALGPVGLDRFPYAFRTEAPAPGIVP